MKHQGKFMDHFFNHLVFYLVNASKHVVQFYDLVIRNFPNNFKSLYRQKNHRWCYIAPTKATAFKSHCELDKAKIRTQKQKLSVEYFGKSMTLLFVPMQLIRIVGIITFYMNQLYHDSASMKPKIEKVEP